MKNILIVILVLAVIFLAYLQFKPAPPVVTPSVPVTAINDQNPSPAVINTPTSIPATTTPVTQNVTAPNGWKTYTNPQYGFTFNYPATWKLTDDTADNQVTIATTDLASSGGGQLIPTEQITFKATDKSFFNPPIGTKMGEITYDENLMAIVDADENNRCLPASGFFNSSLQSITYGGSNMSDPAYSDSAILTKNGNIIIVSEQQETPMTSELQSVIQSIANSFELLNGNNVVVPACASGN